MPHSIDIGDLVQDGVIGLIDAAHRFDEARGIKFETFAERRVRGAMIDALRKDAWPRGVRRVSGASSRPRARSCARAGPRAVAGRPGRGVGSDEKRLGPDDRPHQHHRVDVAAGVRRQRRRVAAAGGAGARPSPSARRAPTSGDEVAGPRARRHRVAAAARAAVIGLYYYGEVTMKQIGAEIGVNESRVSQLHARAIRRLREALGADDADAANARCDRGARARPSLRSRHRPRMAKADAADSRDTVVPAAADVRPRAQAAASVVDYASVSRAARSKSPSRNGLASQRQPLSSRKRSASVPATSPVTKITRRASAGVAAAMAR